MSSKKSTTTQSKSFRFSKETADLIAFGAASHRCSQVQFLEFLVRQEKAKNEKESKLISYVLARQNSKLEKLDYAIDDLGSILLDFIFLVFQEIKEGDGDKSFHGFMNLHRKNIACGYKGFIRRLYHLDGDVTWENIQAKAQDICSKTESKQGNGDAQ